MWEDNLLVFIGRGFVREGGKDECLINVAVPHVLQENQEAELK